MNQGENVDGLKWTHEFASSSGRSGAGEVALDLHRCDEVGYYSLDRSLPDYDAAAPSTWSGSEPSRVGYVHDR